MKVRIHTQGWKDDHGKAVGEEATGSIGVLLELNGMVISEVTRVATVVGTDGFTKVVATLIPGELETVVHDADSWEELTQDIGHPRRAEYRNGLRQLLGRRSLP